MAWKGYRLVYRLLSSLHIGHHIIGNVQRSRHYVPGRNMWGAVTARWARALARDGEPDYKGVGQQVREQVIFSYFYPTLTPDDVSLPPYDARWERQFISSSVSTAIEPGSLSAAGESLHEVEFIQPRVRVENVKPVYLVGYLYTGEKQVDNLLELIQELQIGGERGYGFGRLQQCGCSPAGDIFGYLVDTAGERPAFTIPQGQPLPAHTRVEGVPARGEIEPLVGRETTCGRRWGHKLSQALICWAPGARVERDTPVRVGDYGVLEGGYRR